VFISLYVPFVRDALELVTPSFGDWAWIIGVSLLTFILIELGKFLFIYKKHHKKK
jgi:hypothetical protein